MSEKTEKHHVEPLYRGGKNEQGNIARVSLPDHAELHFLKAMDGMTRRDRNANFGAVRLIVHRMDAEDLVKFNEKINTVLLPMIRR